MSTGALDRLYGGSLALLTDLYQLTMACAHWKAGTGRKEAAFHLHFRKPPFGGGFTVACGLGPAIEYIEGLRFTTEDLDYLASLAGNDGAPLFEDGFLAMLGQLRLSCDVDAVPEGTVVFPHEPLVRVTGPILEAQLLETPLLNLINFQTLIATKAARVCLAAGDDAVLEFGLRRAQGVDGAVSASRAAYVGGCAATSNLLAGKLFGIPVKGTHAHSWVLAFDSELEAFETFARVLPNNCVFLVDTYDSLQGVRHAARVGQELERRGHRMVGIRLDSGDLAYLSREARKILDEAGLADTAILASNDLDEELIESLKRQGATIHVWGVGTRLATAWGDPALGGVYKLTAVREPGEPWQYKVKLSEQSVKISTPGIQQVRRFTQDGQFLADMIWDEGLGIADPPRIVDPADPTRRKTLPAGAEVEDLLIPIFRRGERVYEPPDLDTIRRRVATQLAGLHGGIKRFVHPHLYPAGLEHQLFDLKTRLILEARGLKTVEV